MKDRENGEAQGRTVLETITRVNAWHKRNENILDEVNPTALDKGSVNCAMLVLSQLWIGTQDNGILVMLENNCLQNEDKASCDIWKGGEWKINHLQFVVG